MRPLSILVADDNEDIRTLIERCLTKVGHTVTSASTGEEALEMLQKGSIDLLITDMLMPDGDGLNVIMGLKKINSPVRILVISGGGRHFQSADCVDVAKTLGAHAALFKPFEQVALHEAVLRAMPHEAAVVS